MDPGTPLAIAGWGYTLCPGRPDLTRGGAVPGDQTNQRGELWALLMACSEAAEAILVVSDSEWAVSRASQLLAAPL